jgi:4-hydroxy-3-polyprenylbenzoate decarboxylase
MLKAHEAGAIIMPASPGFYHHPETIRDLIDFVVSRVADHLKIELKNVSRWGEN